MKSRVAVPKSFKYLKRYSPVNCFIAINKDLLEGLDVGTIALAKPLSHQPVELLVGPLLGTAI